MRYLSVKGLLPDTAGYMTYEGSTTHPGCWETAVWLILNKPIYITAREVIIESRRSRVLFALFFPLLPRREVLCPFASAKLPESRKSTRRDRIKGNSPGLKGETRTDDRQI